MTFNAVAASSPFRCSLHRAFNRRDVRTFAVTIAVPAAPGLIARPPDLPLRGRAVEGRTDRPDPRSCLGLRIPLAGQPGGHRPPTSDLRASAHPEPRGDSRHGRQGPLRPSYRADPASRATVSGWRLRGRSRGRGGAVETAGDRGGGGGSGGGGGGARSRGRYTGVCPSDTSREILRSRGANWQPMDSSRESAGAGGRRKPGSRLPFLRGIPRRCSSSTGWRESQKASIASAQDGCCGGIRVLSASAGMETCRLSSK